MKAILLKVWNVVKAPLTWALNIAKKIVKIVLEETITLLQTINSFLN
jgi:hypothetical protein